MNKISISAVTIILLISTLVFGSCSKVFEKDSSSLTKKGVELNWKLMEDDSLYYQTVMTEIGESSFKMDFGELFNRILDSTKTDKGLSGNEFFNKIKDQYNNTNLISVLSNSTDFEEIINIEMIAEENDSKDNEEQNVLAKTANLMMKGTMLRGSVYKKGPLHSFWIKSNQKNLLSLFFELPSKPVYKGESWTLHNVNFIGNDHNFICKKAKKKNIITLLDIKEIDGQTIAVIDYDIREFVSGEFNSPVFLGNEIENRTTEMKFIYKAKAQFSIDQGKWISYNGIMSLDASGVMNLEQKKKFALIEQ